VGRLVAVGLVACVVLGSPASGQAPAPKEKAAAPMVPDPDWEPAPGDEAVVFMPGSATYGAVDYFAFDAFAQALKAKDTAGVRELLGRGRLAEFPHMTPVLVIERHPGGLTRGVASVEVRVREGENRDRKVWMLESALTRLVPARPPGGRPPGPSFNPRSVPGSQLPRGKVKPVPKSAPPKPVPPEARAAAEVQAGKNLRFQGNREAAAERFRGAIKLAPGSPAAKEATRLLGEMGLKP
jgi:hypothetical protein